MLKFGLQVVLWSFVLRIDVILIDLGGGLVCVY